MIIRSRFAPTAVVAALIPIAILDSPARAADGCSVRSGAEAMPLVELYTSEGCSSCPPADRWFSRAAADGAANWLAFHVDYWDSIGWPDRFASAAYSRRQRERVNAVGLETVYTPQVMVGSAVQAQWRSPDGFARLLRGARIPSPVGLAMQLQPTNGAMRMQLGAARAEGKTGAVRVWLAQYVDDQTTQVRAGENSGTTLHHDRVVRHLWGPWPLDATPLSRVQPLPTLQGQWGLVAFVQDAKGETLQSLALPAADCTIGSGQPGLSRPAAGKSVQ